MTDGKPVLNPIQIDHLRAAIEAAERRQIASAPDEVVDEALAAIDSGDPSRMEVALRDLLLTEHPPLPPRRLRLWRPPNEG